MAKLRVAIIGLGMAVAPHARSLLDLADQVEVVAGYSPTEARRRSFAEAYGLPVSGDIEAIYGDGSIDALLVLTPPNTHLDIVSRAARAGKHVLLEKPLEISMANSEALVAAAETAGITLGVVLQNRFRPGSLKLRELLAEGRLGEIVGASARLRNWRPQSYYDEPGRGTLARDGGGVLLTQGIHTVDLLISLAGLPVEVTGYAMTSPVHRMETEDIAAGAMRFANGAMGTISATTTAFPGFAEEIEIIGTKGTANHVGGGLVVNLHDGSVVEVAAPVGSGAGAQPMAFAHDSHRALIADFVDAVVEGRAPMVSGAEALKAHRLIEALLVSARSGRLERVRAG